MPEHQPNRPGTFSIHSARACVRNPRRLPGARLLLPWIVALAAYYPTPAVAHKINVFAHVEGKTIRGEAYFSGRIPARNVKVAALDPAGQELGQTTSDDQGKFSLDARFHCDHRLVVDTGDGHGAEYTLRASQFPKDLPPRSDAPATPQPPPSDADQADHPHPTPIIADPAPATTTNHEELEAIRTQIIELQEQLNDYQQQTHFRDILGGIGYILGISGIAFYFLGKRKQASGTPHQ